MRKAAVLLLYVLLLLKAPAQDHSLDSLNNVLSKAKQDTTTISVLSNISNYYYQRLNKKDTAISITKRCLALATAYRLYGWQVKMMMQLGDQYNYHRQTDSARVIYKKAFTLAEKTNQQENQVLILDDLAAVSHDISADSTLFFTNQAIVFARRNNLRRSELNVLLNAMDIQSKTYIKDSSLSFLNRSLELCGSLKSTRDSAIVLIFFAIVSDDAGNYPIALKKYLQSLNMFKQQKDSFDIATTLLLIGQLYYDQQNYKESLVYQYEAKKVAARPRFNKFWQSFLALGLSYSKLQQRDSALLYAREAYAIMMQSLHFIPPTLMDDLGLIYYNIGEDSTALFYLRQSYLPLVEHGDEANICEASLGIARIFKRMGKTDSSVYYARQALQVALKSGKLKYISDASSILTDYFKSKKLIDSAFFYQQIGSAAYDSLYNREKLSQFQNLAFAEQQRQADIVAAEQLAESRYRSNLKIYALAGVLFIFFLVTFILIRNNRQRRRAYNLLQQQKEETDIQKAKTEQTLDELRSTQAQLIQSEKMASLGELTAGIAHEIQNPLNFVNNFSDVNQELLVEMKDEMEKGNTDEAKAIVKDVIENEQKINHHGKRADAIVKGMLQHSRASSGQKELTDINALCDEYLRLAYHGLRAKDKSFKAKSETNFDNSVGKIKVVPQEIGRVILNLINNAFYTVSEKKKSAGDGYEPAVVVSTRKVKSPIGELEVEISVKDNGNGIPQNVKDKIFQPFFTTKPTGQGTGLGLSLAYDIVKVHRGNIKVYTQEGEFTEFVVQLPVSV